VKHSQAKLTTLKFSDIAQYEYQRTIFDFFYEVKLLAEQCVHCVHPRIELIGRDVPIERIVDYLEQ